VDYILDSGILYFVIAFFIIRHLWKVYINPAAVLGRQAANMNWVVSGRVEDSDGYNNVRYVRDNMEAVVSFQNGNVILTKPSHNKPFKDFIEVERYLATKDKYAELPEEFKSKVTNTVERFNKVNTKVKAEVSNTLLEEHMNAAMDSLRNKWINFNQELIFKEDIPLEKIIEYFITPAREFVVSTYPEFSDAPNHLIRIMVFSAVLESETHSKEIVNAAVSELKKKYPGHLKSNPISPTDITSKRW